jgi:hypothetical protein
MEILRIGMAAPPSASVARRRVFFFRRWSAGGAGPATSVSGRLLSMRARTTGSLATGTRAVATEDSVASSSGAGSCSVLSIPYSLFPLSGLMSEYLLRFFG